MNWDKFLKIAVPLATALAAGYAGKTQSDVSMKDSCTQAINIIVKQNSEAADAKLRLCKETKGKKCN